MWLTCRRSRLKSPSHQGRDASRALVALAGRGSAGSRLVATAESGLVEPVRRMDDSSTASVPGHSLAHGSPGCRGIVRISRKGAPAVCAAMNAAVLAVRAIAALDLTPERGGGASGRRQGRRPCSAHINARAAGKGGRRGCVRGARASLTGRRPACASAHLLPPPRSRGCRRARARGHGGHRRPQLLPEGGRTAGFTSRSSRARHVRQRPPPRCTAAGPCTGRASGEGAEARVGPDRRTPPPRLPVLPPLPGRGCATGRRQPRP